MLFTALKGCVEDKERICGHQC